MTGSKRTLINVPDFSGEASPVTIVGWLKNVGDAVAQGEVLLEAMTDKVNVEIESPAAGVLTECFVAKDQVVKAGDALGAVTTMDAK
jgi:2-oxoglutarate dehydrogenase E2 component (dihydrolipoamide succinyltransferase)